MNADNYQEGWLEWKTKAHGKEACRIRYWIRDESKPAGWRKAALAWESGLTRKQAKKKLDDRMQQVNASCSLPSATVQKIDLTLSSFASGLWRTYRQNRGFKSSTDYGHQSMLNRHVLPEFADRELRSISPADMTGFFQSLVGKGLSTKTRVNVYQLLHAMFEVALDHDLVSSNPVRTRLHRPKHRYGRLPIWTPEQTGGVLREIPEEWTVFFWCLALTTVRIGEILALQTRDIDLDARRITFGRSVWRGQMQETTKTDEVYEKHVTDSLMTLLRVHLTAKRLGPTILCFTDRNTIVGRWIRITSDEKFFTPRYNGRESRESRGHPVFTPSGERLVNIFGKWRDWNWHPYS